MIGLNRNAFRLWLLARLALVGISWLASPCVLAADPPLPLRYPTCEPSAALVVSCIGQPGSCLLVGDNETADALFVYALAEGKPDVGSVRQIRLGSGGVEDIESMAKLDDKTLLLLASHSRNSACEIRGSRRRLMLVSDWGKAPPLQGSLSVTPELSAAALLGRNAASTPVLQAVGAAIDRAEALADSAAKQKDAFACEAAAAFNIEGTVAIPGPAGEARVWVGLRSPLVKYAGKTWAALLRLERPDVLGFDQAVLLDLGGRGVRELTLDGDWLWGIAGGPGDARNNSVLCKLRLGELQPDARLHPRIVRDLPESSEGLAFVGAGQAVVLIDGDRGKGRAPARCRKPAAYLMVDGL